MKKIALTALLLSIFTIQGSIVANAASSAQLAAINRIMSNNIKYVNTTTSTTTKNNSTCKGQVSGSGIYVRSSLNFFDADGNSLKNCIATLAPGTIVTVLDGGEKYFSQQGNMYMYHIKFKSSDGTQKTGYAPAGYIDLI